MPSPSQNQRPVNEISGQTAQPGRFDRLACYRDSDPVKLSKPNTLKNINMLFVPYGSTLIKLLAGAPIYQSAFSSLSRRID
jgi:hypothetical protein